MKQLKENFKKVETHSDKIISALDSKYGYQCSEFFTKVRPLLSMQDNIDTVDEFRKFAKQQLETISNMAHTIAFTKLLIHGSEKSLEIEKKVIENSIKDIALKISDVLLRWQEVKKILGLKDYSQNPFLAITNSSKIRTQKFLYVNLLLAECLKVAAVANRRSMLDALFLV